MSRDSETKGAVSLYKTLGIIGGMGPEATCDLMRKIIEFTDAGCDQQHIHMLVDVNTAIPDRTGAILHGGPDPLPELVRSGQRLAAAGARFLVMACNTAHYFYNGLAERVPVPVLHMPDLTAQTLAAAGVRRAAVLATEGTVESGVYTRALAGAGVEPVYPPPEDQAQITRLIYSGVKARAIPLSDVPVGRILDDLRRRGAEKFVLACTELPIAFAELGLAEDCLDPTRVLALAAVRHAGAPARRADPW